MQKEIGNFGEQAAADYLENKGLKIIKRNFYCRVGELDIIATDGEYTVFVEVKTRKSAMYGRASEFVDYRKQQKIIKTALYYIGSTDTPFRFDVVEVYYHEKGDGRVVDSINHIENAFS
ncbi:MAG: YraN family protein [Eubacteriales bacterium]|nr:YraN family protein [Eubacteriales bacterium]